MLSIRGETFENLVLIINADNKMFRKTSLTRRRLITFSTYLLDSAHDITLELLHHNRQVDVYEEYDGQESH